MAGTDTNPPKPSLHPVYSVTNIQNKVRTLDGTNVTYSSWVKLFKLHAHGYKVLAHIDGTAPPAKTTVYYEQWAEIDAIVLQWIYGTLSDDLLVRVLEPESSAFEAWEKIKHIFLNNKGSRAATLEHEFTNLTLRSMQSLDEYRQRLKDLADQLNDVDNPVNEQRLVLQLVCGLPSEYDTAAAYINQTLPGWDTARIMLQLEQNRQQAYKGHSTTSPSTVTAEANIVADSQSRPQTRTPGGLHLPDSSNVVRTVVIDPTMVINLSNLIVPLVRVPSPRQTVCNATVVGHDATSIPISNPARMDSAVVSTTETNHSAQPPVPTATIRACPVSV
ncbi:hypothetical protein L1887_04283 [Cichorium endivia]|nr:hypothetical protein L1887_04283 [Cichorium endivia]